MSNSNEPRISILPKLINGGIAGMIGLACVFPLDLVKTRLQKQQIGPNGEKMYKNMFDCFKKTYLAEGFFGMYRGSGIAILLITPQKATQLASNDFLRYQLTTNGQLSMFRQTIAGAGAGICQSIILTPMELLKIQLQDAGRIAAQSGGKVAQLTARKVALKLIKTEGITGLFKGWTACLSRDIPFCMIYFPIFGTLNNLGPRKQDGSNEALFWWSLMCGLASGSFSALAVTPFDVIKTRLQTVEKGTKDVEFNGWTDCFLKTLKNEGVTALFKGGLCRIIVIAPLYGIVQMVYYVGIAEYLLGYERIKVN